MSGSDAEKRLRTLMVALAEESLELSDRDVEEEVRARGKDPQAVAATMRQRVAELRTQAARARMAKAKGDYADATRSRTSRKWTLSVPIDALSALVQEALTGPMAPRQLTLQWREGGTPSEEDIRSMAADLVELGLLREPDPSDDS